ncbi:sexual development protein (LsdA), putative [Talaromyces stipitatus ATCC 10500]|uniref:Sexual development protein (LsdA), putative n=1 Tax=Talaromyces stipitatus (strain ATCC 10500 / CBS 375.48 / QM 6759 / NRRL 1006) TaxID=441959 RepID=B8MFP9_TALSN|nr:sexual development protein (LsdA), putative [Talaromyces stipitatus ATCC 10500]EED17039.1 sexual development protein (LsdA), putative [Talaromyces stipitatus ATCC 10500]
MRQNIIQLALCGLAALSTAAPANRRSTNNNVSDEFQSIDGFPAPNPQQLLETERRAHGTLSNSTPPDSVDPDTIISLQVIAAEEQFEAAFFQQLLANVTNNEAGYEIVGGNARTMGIDALTAIVAQEELHALNAINALRHFNQTPVAPCLYNFPVSTLDEAIALAQTFTSVVLGTLQNVVLNMGSHGDAGLTQGVASVIGQEGEQQGFFRLLRHNIPSELPFLTNSVRDFAFNALNQNFIVPGSCPNINQIAALKKLHVMQPLTVTQSFDPKKSVNETVQLSFSLPNGANPQDYEVAYINQQNIPFVLPYTVLHQDGQTLSVTAPFPFGEHLLNGLTILAIVPTSAVGGFKSNQDVADATLAGPGLVVVN